MVGAELRKTDGIPARRTDGRCDVRHLDLHPPRRARQAGSGGVIYSLLRSAAGVALRWYSADVTFVGVERIPAEGPLLVAVNHPNALVDVLVAARATRRQLKF